MDTYPEAGCVQDELPMLVSMRERVWVKLMLCELALGACCGADIHWCNICRQRWVASPLTAEGFALHELQTHEKVIYLVRMVML